MISSTFLRAFTGIGLLSLAIVRGQQASSVPAAPKLEFVFELTAQVSDPIKTPSAEGERRIVPVGAGTFTGPSLRGKLIPGGADYQLIHSDGFTEIEAHYVLETEQGERVSVTNKGMRHAPADVIAKLNAGQPVDQSQIYFRTVPTFDTSAPGLKWMTRALFICTGERYPDGVKIRFYRVY
ncbi:MAG: DUF3237 domain-containing protein [Acidobacteriota bacterium]